MSILDEILERKRSEVEAAQRAVSPSEMEARARAVREPTRGFHRALHTSPAPAVIAEIKRRSPSKGEICADFDPETIATAYAEAGAAAISVLTDEHFFGGELGFLRRVRERVAVPLLRKDFTISPYQVDEARVAGADAILLIVGAIAPEELMALRKRALDLDLDVLVEVHDEDQLEIALGAGVDLLGVNNRNLETFETRLEVTEQLAAKLPSPEDVTLVAESGIADRRDISRLQRAGAKAFLVGESLMKQQDIGAALRRLRRTS